MTGFACSPQPDIKPDTFAMDLSGGASDPPPPPPGEQQPDAYRRVEWPELVGQDVDAAAQVVRDAGYNAQQVPEVRRSCFISVGLAKRAP